MKTMITRACGHQEKIKIYSGGTLKTEVVAGRESLKKCRACGKNTSTKKN